MAKDTVRNIRPFRMIAGVSTSDDLADGPFGYAYGTGDVYWVNGGSDGPTDNLGGGLDREHPLQTIKAALALCVTGHDDTIVVLNYGSNGRGEEDWPILVTKDQVHIIGARATEGSKWSTVKPDESDNAFTVTGHRCEFANLEIGGYSAGSGIEVGNGTWGTTIHDCWFGVTGDTAGTNGVYVAAGADAPYLTVYDCQFGSSLTADGINVSGNCTRGIIRDNVFVEVVGVSINLAGNVADVQVLDNRMTMVAQTAGDGITFGATATGLCDGNSCNYGKSTDTTKYWVSAGTGVNFGENLVNGVLLQP